MASHRTRTYVSKWLESSEDGFTVAVTTLAGTQLKGAVISAEEKGLLIEPGVAQEALIEWDRIDVLVINH